VRRPRGILGRHQQQRRQPDSDPGAACRAHRHVRFEHRRLHATVVATAIDGTATADPVKTIDVAVTVLGLVGIA
jgi:hypothetical protein